MTQPHPYSTHLADAITAARTARGWSTARLAREAGLNRTTLLMALRGESDMAAYIVFAACHALDVEPGSLMEPRTRARPPGATPAGVCLTCRYWHHDGAECRRHATEWPSRDALDWCGDHTFGESMTTTAAGLAAEIASPAHEDGVRSASEPPAPLGTAQRTDAPQSSAVGVLVPRHIRELAEEVDDPIWRITSRQAHHAALEGGARLRRASASATTPATTTARSEDLAG